MILSSKYRFLFIHIPKTGGTSLNLSLAQYGRLSERLAYEGSSIPGLSRLLALATGGKTVERLTGFQAHASRATIVKALGEDRINDLFSFAVTRNPFTRAVSYYAHCRRLPVHAEHELAMKYSFADFVRFELDRHARSKPPAMRFTQRQYVWDPVTQKTAVNALLAMERLEDDVRELEVALNLPAPLRLGFHNRNEAPPDNIEALFEDTVRDFIAILDDEFDRFGYSTDISRAYEPPDRADIFSFA